MRTEYAIPIFFAAIHAWACTGDVTIRTQWLNGQVVDPAGRAIPGVVLGNVLGSTLTDETGHFVMRGANVVMNVRKPGFEPHLITHYTPGRSRITLTPRPERNLRIVVDTRGGGRTTTKLQEALKQRGAILGPYPETPLARCDVLLLATPGPMQTTEKTQLLQWIKNGGRLILLGEWGGYPYQDLGSLNALAQPAGIRFDGSTFKTPDDQLLTRITFPSLQSNGPFNLPLFAGTTLSVQDPARAWLEPVTNGYQILEASPVVVGAVGPLGQGKVFGVGDSSSWRDQLTTGEVLTDTQRLAIAELTWSMANW